MTICEKPEIGGLYRYASIISTSIWDSLEDNGKTLGHIKKNDLFVILETVESNQLQKLFTLKALHIDGSIGYFACYNYELEAL